MASSKKIIEIRYTGSSDRWEDPYTLKSAQSARQDDGYGSVSKRIEDVADTYERINQEVEKTAKSIAKSAEAWTDINEAIGDGGFLRKQFEQQIADGMLGVGAYSSKPAAMNFSQEERDRAQSEFDKSFSSPEKPAEEMDSFVKQFSGILETFSKEIRGATGGIGRMGRLAGAVSRALGGGGVSGGGGGGIAGIGGGGISFNGGGGGGLLGALGAFGGGLGRLAGIVSLVAITFKGLSSLFKKSQEVVTNWNAAVAEANAMAEVRKTQDLLRIAQEKGGEFSEIVNSQTSFDSAMRGFLGEFRDLMSEPVQYFATFAAFLLRIGEGILFVINLVMNKFFDFVEWVFTLGGYLQWALDYVVNFFSWLKKKLLWWFGEDESNENLQTKIDDLFNSKIGPPKP